MSFPHSDMCWSVVCDCGISLSNSFTLKKPSNLEKYYIIYNYRDIFIGSEVLPVHKIFYNRYMYWPVYFHIEKLSFNRGFNAICMQCSKSLADVTRSIILFAHA